MRAAPPQVNMASAQEYIFSEIGPWQLAGEEEDEEELQWFAAPDPLNTAANLLWRERDGIYYTNAPGGPWVEPVMIYFAGTDPRHRGHPPPQDENEFGNPREQWECSQEADFLLMPGTYSR